MPAVPDAGPADGGGTPDAGPPPFAPDGYCPGGPGCADEGDAVLHAGAAVVDVTPVIDDRTDIQTVDVNGNGEFDPFDGDEFADRNGNGRFDGVWIAGYGNGRAASGMNDPQTARAIALRYNQTTLVLVSIDCIGFFWDDVVRVREMVSDLDVDYVAISGTHTHEARDTMGMWGVSIDVTGLDDAFIASVRAGAAQAIRDAVADLRPSRIQYSSFRFRDQPGGVRRYISDRRDPYVIDDEARLMRFIDRTTDATVATLINFGSHPEYAGDANQLLSSDFVHWLRQGIESGLDGPDGARVDGVGGVAVFINGAVGSQIGPQRILAESWDGRMFTQANLSLELAEIVGTQMAYFALQALGAGGGSTTEETAALGYRNHTFLLDIQNRGFHIAFLTPLFPSRDTFNWDPDRPLVPGENEPDLRTEIAVIDIGAAQIITIPGELDPVLFLGGYDGSYTPPGVDIVNTTRENAPDLSAAPAAPYLRDLARADAEMVWLFGLTNDEIGYFVPTYDYVLDPINPYIDEAAGDHYEETVSVGVDAWPTMEELMRELLAWTP